MFTYFYNVIIVSFYLAMFFCPYEDLPHTLGLGPINDAVNMANLFVSRGYKVFFLLNDNIFFFTYFIEILLIFKRLFIYVMLLQKKFNYYFYLIIIY
jgi:hypothetical protein